MSAAITGMGAVTSVGHGAVSACAAIRAGISRATEYAEFQLLDEETQSPIPLMAHPMRGYTDGFSLVGRWLRLARGAVLDLITSGAAPDRTAESFWRDTTVLAVTAAPDEDVFLPEEAGGATVMVRDGYLDPLPEALGLPLNPARLELIPLGRTGVAAAFQSALTRLGDRSVERVLVLAADSMFDPLLLNDLASRRRLKTPEVASGLMPGEAAACLLLESPDGARRRRVEEIGRVMAARRVIDPAQEEEQRRVGGRALADCIEAVLDQVARSTPFSGDVVLDLNGEYWRAMEWGAAQVRLQKRLGRMREHLPCVSIGDTGAASAAVGVCFAIHLRRRGASLGDKALVVSSSEGDDLSAIALGSPRD